MSNNENLKPCPFCGGEAEVKKGCCFGGDVYFVECKECLTRSSEERLKAEAIAAWNKRSYQEKQDSPEDLMDFVRFCTRASDGCIVYINSKARDLIAKYKGKRVSVKQNGEKLDTKSVALSGVNTKLTYADIEKMVKLLKWEYFERKEGLDTVKGWKSNLFFSFYEFKIRVLSEGFKRLYLHNGDGHTIPIKSGTKDVEYYKSMAQKWLVDLVAAALGVERSGE